MSSAAIPNNRVLWCAGMAALPLLVGCGDVPSEPHLEEKQEALATPASVTTASPTYVVRRLGGFSESGSDNGFITGQRTDRQAVVWRNNDPNTFTVLQTPPEYSSAYGYDVNATGHAVGVAFHGSSNWELPIIWRSAQPTVLSLPSTPITPSQESSYQGAVGRAFSINASGQIIGYAGYVYQYTAWPFQKLYYYLPVTWTNDVPRLLETPPDIFSTSIGGINDRGESTGCVNLFGNPRECYVWGSDGRIQRTLLPPTGVPPINLRVRRINAAGAVLGITHQIARPGHDVPAVWEPEATTARALPLPGGAKYGQGFGMNDAGVVVGAVTLDAGSRAFLWRNDQPIDLNDLIDPASGWHLAEAWDISNDGRIIGWGSHNGTWDGFVLTLGCVAQVSEWRQYEGAWADDPYAFSYSFPEANLALLPADGVLTLCIGSTSRTVTLTGPQRTLANLASALQLTDVAATANVQGRRVDVYNTACANQSCLQGTHELRLLSGATSCSGTTNATSLLSQKTMHHFGCGTTALAVGLHAAGVNDLTLRSSAMELDPGSLNDFMANRLETVGPVQGAYTTDANPSSYQTVEEVDTKNGTNKLEFVGFDQSQTPEQFLDDALCKLHLPVLVRVGGHTVLVREKSGDATDGSQYKIWDPGHSTTSTLKDYGNQYRPQGYVKDPPDLSQLRFMLAGEGTLLVKDDAGRAGGDVPIGSQLIPGVRFIDEPPLADIETNAPYSSPRRTVQLLRPLSGSYAIQVKGTQFLALEVHSRRAAGGIAAVQRIEGFAAIQASVHYAGEGSVSLLERVTPASLLGDLTAGVTAGLMHKGVASSLSAKLSAVQAALERDKVETALDILEALRNEIRAQSGKHIAERLAGILLARSQLIVSAR